VRIIAPGCGVVLFALLTACSGVNTRTNSFNTLADAKQAGAIEQGLLPDGLPSGARDIRVGYVPGPVRSWGLFNFPPEQADALKQILRPDELSLDGKTVDVPGRIEWWPKALRGTLNAEQLGITGLKAYATLDTARIVAVNWRQGRAYYWVSD
jgi:hypothetical protein